MLSRMLLLALLTAGLSTQALADDSDDGDSSDWRPEFVAFVPKDKLKAAFPKQATGSGEAALDCIAASDGRLLDCKVGEETPVGQGFGDAALSIVRYERIRTKDSNGASVAGRHVRTHFEFLAPGDKNPDWLRKPDSADLAAVFPTKALRNGVGGRASISCDVTVEGFLQNCRVLSEYPADVGFGSAGLQLAPQFRMSPKIRGGKAVPGGSVTIPINWGAPTAGSHLGATPVLLDPPWARVPTQAEIDAAWPKGATGVDSGQVALRCDLTAAGQLRHCDVISENPRGKDFGKAAQSLSKLFQVNVAPGEDKKVDRYKVDLPVRFRDPSTPDNRKLNKAHWTQTLSPEGMAAAYPELAIKAGVKSGQGSARCTLTATGALTHCEAVRESPVGLGFGAAAVKAASAMRMNPWTKEGDTVEGLALVIPIQFNWNDEDAAQQGKPAAGQP